MIRFSAAFLAFILLFAALAASGPAQAHLHRPLSEILAGATATILGPFGPARADGVTLHFRGFSVEVVEACDGVLPAYIFLAAVLAFPSAWRAKGWGVLLGVPAIFLINLTRLVTLVLLGAWRPEWFERVHIYVWQALVIALSMAIWIFWAERFVRPASGVRA